MVFFILFYFILYFVYICRDIKARLIDSVPVDTNNNNNVRNGSSGIKVGGDGNDTPKMGGCC